MMESSRLPQHRHSGFTLIELIVVMMVIGILAVVVLPRFDLLKGFDEIGYRDQVKATLEYARKSAVAQRRYVCVLRTGNNLDVSVDRAIPENRQAFTGPPAALPLVCPREQALTLPGGSASGIVPRGSTTLAVTSAAGVVFDALGRPWTSTSTTVSSAAVFTVHGDSDYTITVEAETGYVH